MIPHIPRITVEPQLPNERLWELVRKDAANIATHDERAELDALCAELEAKGGDAFQARAASPRPQPASRFSRSVIAIARSGE